MRFPVVLTPEEEGGFFVTFPDIPEANSHGDSVEDALEMAKGALETALDFYFDASRPVPAPSKPKRKQHVVPLRASVAAKVLLLNEMLAQEVRPGRVGEKIETDARGRIPLAQSLPHIFYRPD